MRAAFLGGFFPEGQEKDIAAASIGAIANANNAFQYGLIAGLSYHYSSLKLISLPQIGAFPVRYRRLRHLGAQIQRGGRDVGYSVSFINLVGVKHLSRYVNARKALRREVQNGLQLLFVYDAHAPFMRAAYDCKRLNPALKICLIVPDIPGFTGNNETFLHKMLAAIEGRFIGQALAVVDCFVLLSEHMAEKLPISGKPTVLVEGIYNVGNEVFVDQKSGFKTVFYSGSLDRRNGVLRLLEAFQAIRSADFRLVICGAGDSEREIHAASLADDRISFTGQLNRADVLRLQRASTLLVNPRTSEGIYTRYSFPSKTMEYLASGVPVLMHPLDGIPREYYDFCYVVEDLSISALTNAIERICNEAVEVLTAKGEKARNFILESKNPIAQCERIKMLIDLASE